MIEIIIDDKIEVGMIYLITFYVKCIHCGHEIPMHEILKGNLGDPIVDNGGCKKISFLYEYGKNIGVIHNIKL